ncbi:MAG: hypothetical protein ACFFD1_13650 [Candidatus Thorarchaeota archaeon]
MAGKRKSRNASTTKKASKKNQKENDTKYLSLNNKNTEQSQSIVANPKADVVIDSVDSLEKSNILSNEMNSSYDLEICLKQINILKEEIIQKEELIKVLKNKLKVYHTKLQNIRDASDSSDILDKWKDSALNMSQFIADRLGYTQGEVLEKFGLIEI